MMRGAHGPTTIKLLSSVCTFGLLTATFSITVFFYEIVYAQNNPTDSVSQRTIVRSPQYDGSLFANQISVASDKQIYRPHENINISITNAGTKPVKFSSSDSDIKIINMGTNESFIPATILLSSVIPSGSSKVILWNKEDFTGQQVKTGNYSAIVTVGSLKGNATFIIK